MNISRDDAKVALASIHEASSGVAHHRYYRMGSPFLILWGVIWAVCNTITDLAPPWAGRAWLAGTVVGAVFVVVFTVRMAAQERRREFRADHRDIGRRFSILGTTVMCYFAAMFVILAPLTPRQTNAFISLSWALVYMASGAWVGIRMTIIGAVTATGILVGFLFIEQHFALWMAVFGGGSLIAAGLWLRKL